jgi:hypothetical protein
MVMGGESGSSSATAGEARKVMSIYGVVTLAGTLPGRGSLFLFLLFTPGAYVPCILTKISNVL